MQSKEDLSKSWKLWKECLLGNDSNCIFTQIHYMIWDAAIYRLILESRQIQLREHKGLPGFNARLHMFIDWNFFVTQTTSIRKLLEDHYGLHGRKGVYSLRALLRDINIHREQLTREAFLDLQGLPYSYSRESNHPDEFVWIDINEAHQRFDRLSSTLAENRAPSDLISNAVFDKLSAMLDSCNQIAMYVNKHIAHASTPESRILDNADEIKINLNQIWSAHKNLYLVAEYLSETLFGNEVVPLPLESPDLFGTANIPVIEINQISTFEKVWQKYREETELWRLDEKGNLH